MTIVELGKGTIITQTLHRWCSSSRMDFVQF